MKFSLKLLIIVFALFFNTLIVSEAKGQAFTEILKRMRNHQNALLTLRTNLTMTNYNTQLAESDVYQGSAVYIRSGGRQLNLRVDWIKPIAETISFINGKYIFYRPRLNQAIVGDLDKTKKTETAKAVLSIIYASKKELKANYIFSYLGQETIKGGVKTFHLAMTPKKRVNFMSAEIWVDADGMVRQAKWNQLNKDWTTVLLSELKKNAPVTATDLLVNLPKDAKVIKNSEVNFQGTIIAENVAKTIKKTAKRKTAKRVKAQKKRLSLKGTNNTRVRRTKTKLKSSQKRR